MNLKRVALLGSALVGIAVAFSAAAEEGKKGRKGDVLIPSDAAKWEPAGPKGVYSAKLWGDREKGGPYGALIKFDPGTLHELHKHTHDLKIVVISGTWTHQPDGGAEVRMGPGSYVLQRGGALHSTGCPDGCTFFMTSNGKFDLIPAKAPAEGKK